MKRYHQFYQYDYKWGPVHGVIIYDKADYQFPESLPASNFLPDRTSDERRKEAEGYFIKIVYDGKMSDMPDSLKKMPIGDSVFIIEQIKCAKEIL